MRRIRRLIETGRALARRRDSGRRPDAGMTLLEIMVVLAIIAIVAGAIGVGVFNQFKKAQVKIARQQAEEIGQAVQRYMMNNNSQCPTSVDDLVTQKELPKRPKDPWNKDFTIRCPGQGTDVDVISAGPNHQEGDSDDVAYPEKQAVTGAPGQ